MRRAEQPALPHAPFSDTRRHGSADQIRAACGAARWSAEDVVRHAHDDLRVLSRAQLTERFSVLTCPSYQRCLGCSVAYGRVRTVRRRRHGRTLYASGCCAMCASASLRSSRFSTCHAAVLCAYVRACVDVWVGGCMCVCVCVCVRACACAHGGRRARVRASPRGSLIAAGVGPLRPRRRRRDLQPRRDRREQHRVDVDGLGRCRRRRQRAHCGYRRVRRDAFAEEVLRLVGPVPQQGIPRGTVSHTAR